MFRLFDGCGSLAALDTSGWDTSAVRDTDHHWNGEGTVLAYEKWCGIKGFTPLSREDIQRETVPNFYGALYSSGGYRNVPADEFHLIHPRKRLWVDYGKAKKTHDFIDEGKATLWFDNKHTVFGEVTEGMNVVLSIPEHRRSEERRVGKECRSRWSPYH